MMKHVLKLIRAAQWRWDYVTASHGASFHAPMEVSRILSKLGVNQPVAIPDLSTKAKAQAYLGLDMKKLTEDKKTFLSTVIPEWDKKARQRQSK
jgi:nitrite reductase (cytochrome c-552)